MAFAIATVIPLAVLAFGVRRQLTTRLVAQHERRVQGLARVAGQDLERESASIAARLSSLARALRTDDRFRLATIRGDAGERAYVLDWGEQATRTTGLSMLQLQDEQGRIVSSGHFRNEFDRLEPELPRLLSAADNAVLVRARAPDGPFLALARTDSIEIGGRRFDLVGGITVDSAFLQRFAREEGLAISLVTPEETLGTSSLRATTSSRTEVRRPGERVSPSGKERVSPSGASTSAVSPSGAEQVIPSGASTSAVSPSGAEQVIPERSINERCQPERKGACHSERSARQGAESRNP
jgi:hypothetical protein